MPIPTFLLPLLTEQVERGEAWPYVIHDGTGARRPLSAVHVQQQLDESQEADEPTPERRRGHIEDVLEDPASCHLLLESGPGSGKSTLLARLAGHLSAELLNATLAQNACVPVWATAEQLATGPGGVDRELSRLVFGGTEYSERRFVDAADGLLPEGYSWLLLVDGFDEIPMGARNRLAHQLTAIARGEATMVVELRSSHRAVPCTRWSGTASPRMVSSFLRWFPSTAHNLRRSLSAGSEQMPWDIVRFVSSSRRSTLPNCTT